MVSDTPPLSDLLARAFPNWADFPEECWVVRALTRNRRFTGIDEAILLVLRSDASTAFLQRLVLEHPSRKPHLRGWDAGIQHALTEAEAFAWATEVARLGEPTFTMTEGTPDLSVAGGVWVEAKTVERSDDDGAAWVAARERAHEMGGITSRSGSVASIGRSLLGKFDDHLADAARKWERQGKGGPFVVFFSAVFDTNLYVDEAVAMLKEWAQAAAGSGVRIVITSDHDWVNPLVDTGPP